MSLVTTPAILLRVHPYSETSQILRFFSRDAGVVGVMAKGVRKAGGRGRGALSTFSEGSLTYYHREGRELQTFRDFAPERDWWDLARDPRRFAGAGVLGELILQHAGSEGNPDLYGHLTAGFGAVAGVRDEDVLTTLLLQIWTLIGALGYTPTIRRCVGCGRELGPEEMGRFDFGEGGVRCPRCQTGGLGPRLGPQARRQLAGLVDRSLQEAVVRPLAHLRLASDFITYHISGGTPLRALEVLAKLIPDDDA